MARNNDDRLEAIETWVERSYEREGPIQEPVATLSPWHVREAMRELLAEVTELRARVKKLENK